MNKIKKELASGDVKMAEPPQQTMIDTSSPAAVSEQSLFESQMDCLLNLGHEIRDEAERRAVIDLLNKVIGNILRDAMEPKFRTLKKANKGVQERILKFKNAVRFLTQAGFTDNAEAFVAESLDTERLGIAQKAIVDFVTSLGADMQAASGFNPYQSAVTSTAGMTNTQIIEKATKGEIRSKLDLQNEEIARLKREKVEAYEGRLDDREIEVYNAESMAKLEQQRKLQELWNQEKEESIQQQIDTSSKPNTEEEPDDDQTQSME